MKNKYKTVLGLLSDKSRWTKCALAKDSYGDNVGPLNPEAEKFCLIGAIQHVYPIGSRRQASEKMRKALHKLDLMPSYQRSLIEFNDEDATHSKLIKALKVAKI